MFVHEASLQSNTKTEPVRRDLPRTATGLPAAEEFIEEKSRTVRPRHLGSGAPPRLSDSGGGDVATASMAIGDRATWRATRRSSAGCRCRQTAAHWRRARPPAPPRAGPRCRFHATRIVSESGLRRPVKGMSYLALDHNHRNERHIAATAHACPTTPDAHAAGTTRRTTRARACSGRLRRGCQRFAQLGRGRPSRP